MLDHTHPLSLHRGPICNLINVAIASSSSTPLGLFISFNFNLLFAICNLRTKLCFVSVSIFQPFLLWPGPRKKLVYGSYKNVESKKTKRKKKEINKTGLKLLDNLKLQLPFLKYCIGMGSMLSSLVSKLWPRQSANSKPLEVCSDCRHTSSAKQLGMECLLDIGGSKWRSASFKPCKTKFLEIFKG